MSEAAAETAGPAAADAPPATRDADRTRQRILAAAEVEFAEKGLAGARVDTIAEVSGANKRMIYYYFNSKEDLYVAVLERAYAAMRDAERGLRLDHLQPRAAIRRLVEFKFDYFAEHPRTISLLNGENMMGADYLKRSTRLQEMHAPLVRAIQGILEAGAAAGQIRPGIDALQLYISIAGISYFFFANTPSLSAAFGRDLASVPVRRQRRAHVAEVIMAFVSPPLAGEG